MPLSAGERLGPYEILSPLGAGGMGEVYKARDTRLGRMVAVKVSKAAFSERFEREARAVASLNHSNICTLHDVGPNYLVMEYIEGMPLKGPMPVDQALKYGAQICDALDAAHTARASPIAISSPRTFSAPRPVSSCWISAWRNWGTRKRRRGPRPPTPLWPWRSPGGTRSWVRSTTCLLYTS